MDFFHRQRNVPGWDDSVIASEVALVLGCGGIGCSIAMCLSRLGVREVIIVDRDTVDATNLNRQILFNVDDIGKSKVVAAKANLEASHAGMRTKVTALHVDVIREWDTVIVPVLERATVIFNAIDWGECFDYVINSAALTLELPYASASSYAHTAIAESYAYNTYNNRTESALPTKGCFGCSAKSHVPSLAYLMSYEHTRRCATLDFLPRDDVPRTGSVGSSVLPCTIAAEMAVNMWINAKFNGSDTLPQQSIFDLAHMELTTFRTAFDASCQMCSPLRDLFRALCFGCEPVLLAVSPGQQYSFNHSADWDTMRAAQVAAEFDRLSAKRLDGTLTLRDGLPKLFAVRDNEYQPCVPAVELDADLLFKRYVGDKSLPGVLIKPLLKVAEGPIHGLRSGVRSAIVFNNDVTQAVRLKGCNTYCVMDSTLHHPHPSFPVVPMEYHEHNGVHVRGCQFMQTAAREQLMCHSLSKLVQSRGLKLGNEPLGITQYELECTAGHPRDLQYYCGLFRTVGDKRLSTHLLFGLELMAPAILCWKSQANTIMEAFPRERRTIKDGTQGVQPTYRYITSSDKRPSELVNALHFHFNEDFAHLHALDEAVSPRFSKLWQWTVHELQEIHSEIRSRSASPSSLLAHVFARIGYEVAAFQWVLHENNISWGYFYDHWPAEPHNNAHPNNFVLVADEIAAGGVSGRITECGKPIPQYIAAVDFDLAFEKSEFIDNITGVHSSEQFDEYTRCERQEMLRNLGGDDGSNSGVVLDAASSKLKSLAYGSQETNVAPLCYLLRDTMVLAWYESWKDASAGKPRPTICDPTVERGIQLLIRLALMLTDELRT